MREKVAQAREENFERIDKLTELVQIHWNEDDKQSDVENYYDDLIEEIKEEA